MAVLFPLTVLLIVLSVIFYAGRKRIHFLQLINVASLLWLSLLTTMNWAFS